MIQNMLMKGSVSTGMNVLMLKALRAVYDWRVKLIAMMLRIYLLAVSFVEG